MALEHRPIHCWPPIHCSDRWRAFAARLTAPLSGLEGGSPGFSGRNLVRELKTFSRKLKLLVLFPKGFGWSSFLNPIWILFGPANNGTPIRLFEKNASAEARSMNV